MSSMDLFGGPGVIIFVLLSVLAVYIFTIIDILRSEFDPNSNKIIWVLVIILLPFLGTLLYLAIGRGQRVKQKP